MAVRIGEATAGGFTAADVERARRYHRGIYRAVPLDAALGFGVLGTLAFGPPSFGLPWWAEAAALTALTVVAATIVRLPLTSWRGYRRDRRWGFSTQSVRGWLADRAKALGVSVAIAVVYVLLVVGLARAFPGWWPLAAAPAVAGVTLALGLAGPLLLEPLFNRFAPLEDEALAADLRALADRAGVPVRDVLVVDASRRTRKANAYVSGLGPTRRVVVFDTLLARAQPRELRLVVAHELGHRRARHVAKGTALGALGAAYTVLWLWGLLSWPTLLGAIGARGAGDPRVAPFLLLVPAALELLGLPLQAALSRRWERVADTASLELTRDPEAFERAHRSLARSNLIDLVPSRAAYLLLFTHPTPPERIAAARRWAAGAGNVR